MASQSLISTVDSYENYIERNGIDEQAINAYVDACSVAINGEKDIEYGLQLTKRAKELIEGFCTAKTGGTIWDLEKYAFDHKTTYELINKKYEVLLLEAQIKEFIAEFRDLIDTLYKFNQFGLTLPKVAQCLADEVNYVDERYIKVID